MWYLIGFLTVVTFILIFNYGAHRKNDDIDHQIEKWFKEEARKKDQKPCI